MQEKFPCVSRWMQQDNSCLKEKHSRVSKISAHLILLNDAEQNLVHIQDQVGADNLTRSISSFSLVVKHGVDNLVVDGDTFASSDSSSEKFVDCVAKVEGPADSFIIASTSFCKAISDRTALALSLQIRNNSSLIWSLFPSNHPQTRPRNSFGIPAKQSATTDFISLGIGRGKISSIQVSVKDLLILLNLTRFRSSFRVFDNLFRCFRVSPLMTVDHVCALSKEILELFTMHV
ncbi:unnamed protein product [Albugo candida]|uniref:Uncharacterized protein n=1 Tax=Albugo candida TaxID=65357 RepID=A0A024GBG8_9STRA|nr:unnamed protein product [Albugo candida]|eukprot:CCI44113.1 unnamed protein product [Albugo candida]